jgi:hypothetical protein
MSDAPDPQDWDIEIPSHIHIDDLLSLLFENALLKHRDEIAAAGYGRAPRALDRYEVDILQALKRAHPRTLGLLDLALLSEVAERTIRDRLPFLIAAGYVDRRGGPRGRGGVAITTLGVDVLRKHFAG